MTDELRQNAMELLPELFEQLGLDEETTTQLLAAAEGVLEDDEEFKWNGEDGRSHIFTLTTPIRNMKGEDMHSLKMRKGRLSDLTGIKLGAKEVKVGEFVKLAAKMCNTTVARIGELEDKDVGPVLQRARSFFQISL